MSRAVRIVEIDDRGHPAAVLEVQTIDISRAGLGFLSQRPYPPGRCLLVEIPNPGERVPTFLYGLVRHSRPVPGQGHLIGLEVASIPQSAPILEWMAQRVRSAA